MSVQGELFGKAKKPSKGPPQVEEIVAGGFDVRKFVENFEVLAEAAGGVGKLRWLVLELAVRGRLVEQRAGEGSGGSALERARDHAAVLVTKGERRQRASYALVTAEERPFDVPKTWAWARFGELGDWGAGATPSRSNSSYYGGDTPWFKSGELNDGYVENAEERVTSVALRECSLRLNQPGDVMIAMYGATIGKVGLARVVCTTNQAVCACTCNDGINNEFLFRVLKAFRHRFIEQGAGGAQPNISRVKIVETACPVPPLAEQKRIVAKVDELMALCDDLEARQAKKRETGARLTKSALEALTTAEGPEEFEVGWKRVVENFEVVVDRSEKVRELRRLVVALALQGRLSQRAKFDESASASLREVTSERGWRIEERPSKLKVDPKIEALVGVTRVPTGWVECRLNDVAQLINGRAYAQPELLPTGTPVIRIQNLNGGRDWYYSDLTLPERQYCDTGDLLFAWSASFGPYIWGGKKAIYHYHIWKLNLSAAIDKKFLYFSLLHITDVVREQSHGLAMLHMTKGQMERWPILLPPVAEQKRLVAKVEQFMALCDELETKLRLAEARAAKLVEAVVREMVA